MLKDSITPKVTQRVSARLRRDRGHLLIPLRANFCFAGFGFTYGFQSRSRRVYEYAGMDREICSPGGYSRSLGKNTNFLLLEVQTFFEEGP